MSSTLTVIKWTTVLSVANGGDSDAANEESEGEEPETTAMMLSDEVPSLVTHKVKSKRLDQSHGKSQSARDPKTCRGGSKETTTACGESSEPYSSELESPKKLTSATRSAKTITSLIRTEKGNIKLLDQNHETCLVEPHIPLLRRDLKMAACANIDGYFRLGQNIVKAKKLMEQHAYVYALRFNSNDDASPIGKKPYQAKSIGLKYAGRFGEIASNKGDCPEIPIPLLALVATAVMSFLLGLHAGLTGFQDLCGPFLEDAWFAGEVQLYSKFRWYAWCCFNSDTDTTGRALRRKGNDHLASEHQDALALLDLDGMAED
ncbi:hypothetical protein DFJ58DRAFT_857350 [Suillus subalutaceus]|uniref:uncharacterized protein n=1 Tax=Suillus subalutaceus TaxID=48586 RepID=UPI001B861EFC|nr:uncharacterized protein DFJ58DRAFT_857350 [Suillus subalutaceus]KAG1869019.1 hypothetical protein DFJ58DRAFT_857350 [Suillus subalutaceus]